jgi:ATP synthase protein I
MIDSPDDRSPKNRNGADPEGGDEPATGDWYKLAGLGFEFIAAVAVGIGIGYLLDRWLGIAPWGLIGGVALGFTLGLRGLIRRGMSAF